MESPKHPLEAMVTEHSNSEKSEPQSSGSGRPEPPANIELTDPTCDPPPESSSSPPAPDEQKVLQAPAPREIPDAIDLAGIDRPALILDADMSIKWQNHLVVEQLWHNAGAGGPLQQVPNVFDMMFDPVFKRNVANFSNCIDYFLMQLLEIIPKDQLLEQIDTMDDDRKVALMLMIERMNPENGPLPWSDRYFHQAMRNGETRTFEVFAMNFKEGRLLIFDRQTGGEAPRQVEQPHCEMLPVEHIRQQPEPIKSPYILLATHLNNAPTLRIQMLADEYRRLINDLSQRCLYKVEQYGGIFGKHVESGFFAYFLRPQDKQTDPLRVIECALEIKELMVDLGREWKIRKDWLHDIELNMGIHYEDDYIGVIGSSMGEMITSFGDGLRVVSAISQLSRNGQIWATKPLIHQLVFDDRKHLRFGILRPGSQRHHPFVRNGFACLQDVLPTNEANVVIEETLGHLPITQIFDMSGLKS